MIIVYKFYNKLSMIKDIPVRLRWRRKIFIWGWLIYLLNILINVNLMGRALLGMRFGSMSSPGEIYGLNLVIILQGRGSLIKHVTALKKHWILLIMSKTLVLFLVHIASFKRKWLWHLLIKVIDVKPMLSRKISLMNKSKQDC